MTLTTQEAQRESLYRELAPLSLAPLWVSLHELVTPQPRTKMRAAAWNYAAIRPMLLRAADAISAQEAVRRVLILENPGAPGTACITGTLYAGLQIILPGEVAPAHRHTQSAFRFIVEGKGAYTTVDGERFDMHPGDLILTPNLCWHDHGHDGDAPVVWLDGLDIPLVRLLDASFAESHLDARQQTLVAAGTNKAAYGSGLKPSDTSLSATHNDRVRRFYYPYREWREALQALASDASARSADESYTLEFANPVDGGSVLPTMSAFCSLLAPGHRTRPQRRTDACVGHVVEGAIEVTCDEATFELTVHDTFVIPSWATYQLRAVGADPAILFSYSDRASQRALGLWRHELL
jgi:gentisate 1,2-dioxygenase